MVLFSLVAMDFTDSSTFAATKDQVSCELDGETAILNLKNGTYYGLDKVGTRIWTLLQQPRTFAELRDILLEEYEVPREQLESDLKKFLASLIEQQLLEVTP